TLGVRTIVEGSVRRAGNRIRVTAQLINAEDGSHLWSERYDREMVDVFAMQDEIAAAIAGALQLNFTTKARYTPNLAAYETYLKGVSSLYSFTTEGLAYGKECCERAISLDPNYAAPHSTLGSYFYGLCTNGLLPSHQGVPLARAQLNRALEMDPTF